MRGHRLLFVLASLVALGLVGFANFPGDRHAVADSEASQMVGGCSSSYTIVNCGGTCGGACYCCSGQQYACSPGGICGGGSTPCTCGTLCFYCTGG
jgi:hypothetical protein